MGRRKHTRGLLGRENDSAFRLVLHPVSHQRTETSSSSSDVRYCDIGCGIGSVLQTVMWCFATYLEKGTVVGCGLEAQEISAKMARRSLSFNLGPEAGAEESKASSSRSWRVFDGDLRDDESIEALLAHAGAKFDLVTGTPPYFEVAWTKEDDVDVDVDEDENENEDFGGGGGGGGGGGADAPLPATTARGNAVPLQGGMPSCAQSAPARNEFRGGIEVYCAAAAKLLAPDGLFAVVNASINTLRTERAATAAGLFIESRLDVCGRVGKKPLFSVWAMRRSDGGGARGKGKAAAAAAAAAAGGAEVKVVYVRRDENGKFCWTPEWRKYMAELGVPPR